MTRSPLAALAHPIVIKFIPAILNESCFDQSSGKQMSVSIFNVAFFFLSFKPSGDL